MSEYRLTINRIEPNPKFDPKSLGPRSPYDRELEPIATLATLETGALSVLVTQEQFEAIRKAVLEKF